MVVGIESFDHVEILAKALESAKERILIVGGQPTRSVVDPAFVNHLEDRLRSRVQVDLVFTESQSDSSSIEVLENSRKSINAICEFTHPESR